MTLASPKISFTIPYYANKDYLAEAIESVREQTVADWELLVVDDAGPEPAEDVVSAIRDVRVRYVRNPIRRGLPGNWNECVSRANAPLVTLLHGDDRLLPTYAERVLETAREMPSAAAYFTGATVIDSEGLPARTGVDSLKRIAFGRSVAGRLDGDQGLAKLLRGNFIYCPTLALRRDAVGDGPFDESWRFVCDWDLTVRLLLDGNSLVGIGETLLEYRRHPSQTTALLTLGAQRFAEELNFLQQIQILAGSKGLCESERAAKWRVATRAHVLASAASDLARGCGRAAWAKGKLFVQDLSAKGAHSA